MSNDDIVLDRLGSTVPVRIMFQMPASDQKAANELRLALGDLRKCVWKRTSPAPCGFSEPSVASRPYLRRISGAARDGRADTHVPVQVFGEFQSRPCLVSHQACAISASGPGFPGGLLRRFAQEDADAQCSAQSPHPSRIGRFPGPQGTLLKLRTA